MQEIQGSKWKRCPSLLNAFGTNHFQRLDGLVLFLQSLGFPSSTLFVTFQASLCDRTFSFFNTVFQPSPILFNISNAQTPVANIGSATSAGAVFGLHHNVAAAIDVIITLVSPFMSYVGT